MTTKPNKFSCLDFKTAGCEPSLDQTVYVWDHEHSWDSTRSIPLRDIRIVRQSDDVGLFDVVYIVQVDMPGGLRVNEVRTALTTHEQLFASIGWCAGLEPKIQLATMASPRREAGAA
jgi:hypothetical protein